MGAASIGARSLVTEMESRVGELEAELASARAELLVARSRVLAERRLGQAGDEVMEVVRSALPGPHKVLPQSEIGNGRAQPDVQPAILLQPLPLHDALRRKWNLGRGLPEVAYGAIISKEGREGEAEQCGYLRLIGLLTDGSPWEAFITFYELGREGGVVIGREPGLCEVVLTDDSVSRMHARLEINRFGLVVSDLNSMNGVFVNENRVDYSCPQMGLSDGAILTLGEVPLRVEIVTGRN